METQTEKKVATQIDETHKMLDSLTIPVEFAMTLADGLYMQIQNWLEEQDAPEHIRDALRMMNYWEYYTATHGGLERLADDGPEWEYRLLKLTLNLLDRKKYWY